MEYLMMARMEQIIMVELEGPGQRAGRSVQRKKNDYTNKAGTKLNNTKGGGCLSGGCYGTTHYPLDDTGRQCSRCKL